MRRAKALESDIQIAVIDWLTIKKIPNYHIPNGGKRGVLEAMRFKRMGVSAGVPDICIPIPRFPFHALYIEVKRDEKAKLSEDQVRWHKILLGAGMLVHVDYDFDSIVNFISFYLEGVQDNWVFPLQYVENKPFSPLIKYAAKYMVSKIIKQIEER